MGHLVLEELSYADRPLVRALLEASEDGIGLAGVTGHTSGLEAGLHPAPMGPRNHLLGLCDPATRELVGIVETVLDRADPCMLVVARLAFPACAGIAGLERQACDLLEAWVRDHRLRGLRVAVDASSLSRLERWLSAGFRPVEEAVWIERRLVVVLEKHVSDVLPGLPARPPARLRGGGIGYNQSGTEAERRG